MYSSAFCKQCSSHLNFEHYCACIYLFIYVCMCVCMHVCVYMCICVYICVCMYCVCVFICIYVHMCMYVLCMYVYVYMCMYMCMCVCMYLYVCVLMCICIYRCMLCLCVCVCVCIWCVPGCEYPWDRCAGVHTHECMSIEAKSQLQMLILGFYHLVFLRQSLAGLETTRLARLAGQHSQGIHLSDLENSKHSLSYLFWFFCHCRFQE